MTDDILKCLITAETLVERVRDHAEYVAKCIADGTHESWTPNLAVWAKSHPDAEEELHLHVLAVPFNEHEDKYGILRKIGAGFYAEKLIPTAVLMSSEAWRSSSPLVAKGPMQPRDDPKRIEILHVTGLGGEHKLAMAGAVINRRDGFIQPVTFDSPEPSQLGPGSRFKILEAFYDGFFAVLREKMAKRSSGN